MDEDIAATVRPWSIILIQNGVSCQLRTPARTEHGVVFSFNVSFDVLTQNHSIGQVRQAIDLVYRVLALDRRNAQAFKETDDQNAWCMVVGWYDPCVQRVLQRNAPFEMEIIIEIHHFHDVHDIKRRFVDDFLVELTHKPSIDPLYHQTKAALDALLHQKNPMWRDRLESTPIKIHCKFECARRLEMEEDQAEDFFKTLSEVVHVLETFDGVHRGATDGHLPVCVNIEQTHFRSPLPITPQVVQAMETITSLNRVGLNCRTIQMDPRLVTCEQDELSRFLDAITKGVSESVTVEILPVGFYDQETVPIDSTVHASVCVPNLLGPLAECENIDTLSIGGLLDMFRSPHSRGVILQVLLPTVLSRAHPMSLHMSGATVNELDAQLLTTLVQGWRAENPGKLLRVKRLVIDLFGATQAYTNALLTALDEVEELVIGVYDENAAPISHDQAMFMMGKFSMLRAIALTNVHLLSMDMFMSVDPPTLQSIELCGFQLDDRESFIRFIDDLGIPDRPLARHLRQLKLADLMLENTTTSFHLNEHEVNCLARSLERNRVLEKIDVTLGEEDFMKRMPQILALTRTTSTLLSASASIRRSPEENVRRVAFLCVLHKMEKTSRTSERAVLDADLVRRVFEFCDPWVERSVFVK